MRVQKSQRAPFIWWIWTYSKIQHWPANNLCYVKILYCRWHDTSAISHSAQLLFTGISGFPMWILLRDQFYRVFFVTFWRSFRDSACTGRTAETNFSSCRIEVAELPRHWTCSSSSPDKTPHPFELHFDLNLSRILMRASVLRYPVTMLDP